MGARNISEATINLREKIDTVRRRRQTPNQALDNAGMILHAVVRRDREEGSRACPYQVLELPETDAWSPFRMAPIAITRCLRVD